MSTVKVYDADQVSVLVGNVAISRGVGASGYADGEFVRIEQQEDDFGIVVGTDGQITRSKKNNKLTKITIRLMQSSDSNAYLSSLRIADQVGQNGAGIVPILINDRNGTSLHSAQFGWVNKPPDAVYDREAKEREWPIMCYMDERLDGGN